MTKPSLSRRIVLAGAASAAILGLSAAAHAETKWDLPVAWPPGNFHTKNAVAFAAAVGKATNGELKITVHPGGALGLKGPETLRAVRDGIVSIAEMNAPQQVGDAPYFGIEALPFVIDDYKQLRELHNKIRPEYDKIAAQFKQKILYMTPWPTQYIYSKVKIASLADLKGIKIRTTDKNASSMATSLGMVPVQMPFADVVPSLASGALGAVTTSATSGVDGKFWEFLKHMLATNHLWSSNMVTVNLDAFNKLPPAQRAALEKVGKDLEPTFWQASAAEDTKNRKILAEKGMVITELTPAMKAEMKKLTASVTDDFIKQVGGTSAAILAPFRK
ncbi:MAG: TRAP transporter substrate-binding protein [Alphaproteobacteria bacterium]